MYTESFTKLCFLHPEVTQISTVHFYTRLVKVHLAFATWSYLYFKLHLLLIFWGRRSFVDPICCSFLLGFALVPKVGFVHPIFSWTLALSGTRDMA